MVLVLLRNQRLMPFDVTQLIVVLTNLSHQKTLESGPVCVCVWWGEALLSFSWGSGLPLPAPLYLVLLKMASRKCVLPIQLPIPFPLLPPPLDLGTSLPLGVMKLQ